ncbi:MAG TPA: GNAT family N-acetyltransferase [Dehalococcoidia bacterium]|nr:GNAT family N-acetyltransferase [Dehalococcoidia bacterium]
MTFEIRPLTPEELPLLDDMVVAVFASDAPPEADRVSGRLQPEWTLCGFEDGELATSYAAFPFVVRLNGGKAPAAGVTVVGTHPGYRRRGYLRRIVEADFRRRYERRMEPLAILLASQAAIYQRYGYAVASATLTAVIDPRGIAFAPDAPAARGRFRKASKDETPLLDRLYRAFSAPRNGYLHRAPAMWEHRVFGRQPPGAPHVAVCEEGGEPAGYVVWSLAAQERGNPSLRDDGPPGQRLYVRDYVWLTASAYRAMWDFFASFDLVARVIVELPVDDPAFHLLLEPRRLGLTMRDHLMARIIDVERALPLRPYGAEGRVVFRVRDALCPWNEGRWALDAGSERASVVRTDEEPELDMPISTLAQLLFGQVAPSQTVAWGRAEASPGARLDLWDAMWRTRYAPFCPDTF